MVPDWGTKILYAVLHGKKKKKKHLKIELPHDVEVPLLGIYSDRTTIQKDTCTSVFIAETWTIHYSQDMETT